MKSNILIYLLAGFKNLNAMDYFDGLFLQIDTSKLIKVCTIRALK